MSSFKKTTTILFLAALCAYGNVFGQEPVKPAPAATTAAEKPAPSVAAPPQQEPKAEKPLPSKPKVRASRARASNSVQTPNRAEKPIVVNQVQKQIQKEPESVQVDSKIPEASVTATGTSAKPPAEPMREGDSIPFMRKNERTAQTESSSGIIWLKTLGAVLLVLGLLFAGTWVVKKTGIAGVSKQSPESSPDLKILSTVTPRNGQTLSVVRFGERVLLVGSTAQSFTLLSDTESFLTEAEETENDSPAFEFSGKPVSVAEMLAREEESFERELEKANQKISLQEEV